MNPATPFPTIYVINLERSVERREAIQADFEGIGIHPVFFKAIDGQRLSEYPDLGYDRQRRLRRYGYELNPGEIACFASHHKLWQRILQQGDDWAVVCEDDTALEIDFARTCRDLIALCTRCEIDYVWFRPEYATGIETLLPVDARHTLVRFRNNPMGSGCYLISRSGARQLLHHAAYWNEPIDHYLGFNWKHGLQPYGIDPPLARHHQLSCESTLGHQRRSLPLRVKLIREPRRLYLQLRYGLANLKWRLVLKRRFMRAGNRTQGQTP